MNRRHLFRRTATLAALAATATIGIRAGAATLDPTSGVDLGGTSFFDGFGATGPGLAYLGYYKYSTYNAINDNTGHESPAFRSPRIDVLALINSVAYTTHQTYFDGTAHLGWYALMPYLMFDTSFASDSPATLANDGNGFGDLTFGPYLQFDPVIRGGRPVFSQRFEFDLIAPIGQYSASKAITPSSGFWSLNPYWAATWLPTPRTEVSWHLSYLYNFANDSPNGLPPTVTSTKAGQAIYTNFTASYGVTPTVHAGINGYYFRQITGDTYNYSNGTSDSGAAFGDVGKAAIFAIGPGLNWRQDKNNIWDVNLYVQTDVHDATRGNQFNIHWIHSF